jgi:MYXO-CTERM domain-containing protein
MTKQILTTVSAIGLCLCLSEGAARAGTIGDCGNIDVEADAQCNVMAKGGCTIDDCTPLACSASLYAKCKGSCELPDVECEGSCQGTCQADCTAKGGSIDCKANCSGRCEASCSGDCSAQCASNANKTECEANCQGTCKASCQGECDASCTFEKPAVDCQAQCQGSCKGSCTVKKNLGCHMECRTRTQASCTGGCEVACTKPDAAIFCNGQYIDHGGNLQSCLDALEAAVSIRVTYDATASGSASCSGGSCEAEGKASAKASCAMSPPGSDAGSWFSLGLFGVVTAGLIRRRRRATQQRSL